MFYRARPMPPRDINEAHRVATPLELLFDLVSVIAIASAAAGLHHALAEAHFVEGVLRYIAAFFCIWWAWMNYTWFASAYDNDDTSFRLLTMVIMAGALTMAAGIGVFFKELSLLLMVIGYVIMRFAMIALWLRAACHDVQRRGTALRYAAGIMFTQVYWVGLLFVSSTSLILFYSLFAIGVVLELSVPAIAERHNKTPWHRHHIVERYGLLNIIVLGETLLAGSLALSGITHGEFNIALVHIALSALVILFSIWWLYFTEEEHLATRDLSRALSWGYGHVMIFLSGAAIGAGIAVLVDIVTHHAHIELLVGDYAVAIPVALYMLGLWFVRDRHALNGTAQAVLPVFAVLIVVIPPILALEGIAILAVLCVMVRSWLVQASKGLAVSSAV